MIHPGATKAARTSTRPAVGVHGSEPRRCPYLTTPGSRCCGHYLRPRWTKAEVLDRYSPLSPTNRWGYLSSSREVRRSNFLWQGSACQRDPTADKYGRFTEMTSQAVATPQSKARAKRYGQAEQSVWDHDGLAPSERFVEIEGAGCAEPGC